MTRNELAKIYEADSKPGPRMVPAKVLSIPTDVDPQMAQAMAASYPDFQGIGEMDADGLRSTTQRFGNPAAAVKSLQHSLGVSVEPVTVGAAKAFLVTPKEVRTVTATKSSCICMAEELYSARARWAPQALLSLRLTTSQGLIGRLPHAAGSSVSCRSR